MQKKSKILLTLLVLIQLLTSCTKPMEVTSGNFQPLPLMKSLILTNDWGYFYNNQKQDVAGEWVHLTTSDFAELLLWTENMIEKGGQ